MGNIKVVFHASASSLTAPTVTLWTGAGAFDASCYLYGNGWAPTQTGNKVSAPRRLCSRVQYEKFGLTTQGIGDFQYMVDPQAAAASAGKKAYETFVAGTTGYILERLGLDAQTVDLAIGQFVIIRPVIFGPQNITGDPTDEAAEFMVTQQVSQTGPPSSTLVAMVA
jgi:hypothetical protein